MKFIKSFTLIVALLFSSSLSFATEQVAPKQEKNKLSLDAGSIDSQFEYVVKKSHNYQEFEVIKNSWMHRLRAHVNDSLKVAAEKLEASQEIINSQKAEIEALTSNLSSSNQNLTQISEEKDSMNFLGMWFSKTAYNAMMWGIVAALAALLIFFIVRYKASNMITSSTKLEYEELQHEFEAFRKRALEREQLVKRELQDERNKHLV
ncbi:MAG: tRNA (guanine-N1)-methyltransferase [Bacteroidia bacterium]|nr:tRNA (guanine-N1)-methyltransferase [Bacteroidia bacterium]NNM16343.1 tRNA (guanine-N1)-methyltransferase [Bacteroidia bacterium]